VSESGGERRFDATPSRIAKAKREGNVPRAGELSGNVAFAAACGALVAIVPAAGALARAGVRAAASGSAPVAHAGALVALALVPMACAAVAGAAASLLQSGGLTFAPVTVKAERVNPVPGLRRMFSRDAFAHGVRALLGVALVGLAVLPGIRDVFAVAIAGRSPLPVAAVAWSCAQRAVLAVAGIGTIAGIFEFGVARAEWKKKLRMTFDEFKREMKESDGDPLARGRRKALHRALVRGSLRRVKDAAFTIVNPTHVAVALAYRPPEIPVPVILVRAADEMALRVRELSAEHRIPVIENVPVARALFERGEVDRPIPVDHFVAVAEIVAALVRTGAIA
jgi:flagellar biosynthetic protein FlhB